MERLGIQGSKHLRRFYPPGSHPWRIFETEVVRSPNGLNMARAGDANPEPQEKDTTSRAPSPVLS